MTDHVDPTERDPRFPDRPTHPHWVRLSNAMQAMDAQADAGTEMSEIIGVDEESLRYGITNRLGILAQVTGGRIDPLALYIDAFTLGKLYAEAVARESQPDDSPE